MLKASNKINVKIFFIVAFLIFPTHLAILAALDFAVENNFPMVDFMGAGKPGVEYGVRQYKLGFGGELVEQGRFLKVLNPTLYFLGKIGLKVLSIISR